MVHLDDVEEVEEEIQDDQESPSEERGDEKPASSEASVAEVLEEQDLTPEEHESLKEAEKLKREGNELYAAKDYVEALDRYTRAIEAAPEKAKERSVYLANRAAVGLALQDYNSVVVDCTESLKIDESYVKALLRRASAFEKLEEEEKALEDYKRVCDLDACNKQAVANVKRLEPIVEQKREKLKEETFAKLKELGNMVLGKFGLSTDNFQAVKDPETGSYSVNFVQNT